MGIFEIISADNQKIVHEDLQRFFDYEDSQQIFRLFDANHDGYIEKDEFISRYLSIFNEKKNLAIALTAHSGGIDKLNTICIILCIPTIVVFLFMCYGAMEKYSSSVGVFAGALLSLSFAFASSISELVD